MIEPGADSITSTYRVIYGDTDQMGVVYYANYLRFFEIGRNEWIRASGMPYGRFEEQGMMLPVAEAACSYRASARYDDLIEIDCWCDALGRASVGFAYRIRRGETVLATGRTKHAVLGTDDGRLKPWPKALYHALDAYRRGEIKELTEHGS